MRFLVFSDSHNDTNGMDYAIEKHKEISHIIHCGDVARDVEYLNMVYGKTHSVCAVKGNNDYFTNEPSERIFKAESQTVFICHGHKFGVKTSLYSLEQAARNAAATVCIFGHTHSQFCRQEDGILLFNPGSIGYFRREYAVLTLEKKGAFVELFKL